MMKDMNSLIFVFFFFSFAVDIPVFSVKTQSSMFRSRGGCFSQSNSLACLRVWDVLGRVSAKSCSIQRIHGPGGFKYV